MSSRPRSARRWLADLGVDEDLPLTELSVDMAIHMLAALEKHPQAPDLYLDGALRNGRRQHERKAYREAHRQRRHRPLQEPEPTSQDTLDRLAAKEEAEALIAMAEALQSKALVLLLASGDSIPSAAKACGISTRTAERRLNLLRTLLTSQ